MPAAGGEQNIKRYNRAEPLIGLHIPKCGGSSLQKVLQGWFGRSYFTHYFQEKIGKKPRRWDQSWQWWLFPLLSGKPRCIYGHFNNNRGTGVEAYYPHADQFFAILRDPLEIVISRYFLAKKMGEGRFRDGKAVPIQRKFHNVNEFVSAQIKRPVFTDYLPGLGDCSSYFELFESKFILIGTLEHIQDSVDRLADVLEMPRVAAPHLNPAPRDEDVMPDLKEAFLQAHALDYSLYQYALDCRSQGNRP